MKLFLCTIDLLLKYQKYQWTFANIANKAPTLSIAVNVFIYGFTLSMHIKQALLTLYSTCKIWNSFVKLLRAPEFASLSTKGWVETARYTAVTPIHTGLSVICLAVVRLRLGSGVVAPGRGRPWCPESSESSSVLKYFGMPYCIRSSR